MTDEESMTGLGKDLRTAWHRYVDMLAPLRPGLHAYCRRLAGNIWDAEDLVQDTLLRAFGQWGVTYPEIRNPRAYLMRTAANVWIDTYRRREIEARAVSAVADDAIPGAINPETSSELRDAGSRLLQRLSPQERAALVLKEAFDMPLDQIAELLATTTGAVKAALHRGRDRLSEPGEVSTRSRPSAVLLDRFIALFDAKDLQGMLELMLDGASAENPGNSFHIASGSADGVRSFFHAVLHGHAEWPPEFRRESSRIERVEFEGEQILLAIRGFRGKEAIESVYRIEEHDGRIARFRSYAFCPETIREIGQALGRRVRTGIYRAPTPAPGADWPDAAGRGEQ
jgi:RNA polymerase sigma-70 factor (ECF subfamily)